LNTSDPIRQALLELLSHTLSPLKAREIAPTLSRQLGYAIEKRAVNRILYQLKAEGTADHDSEYRWSFGQINELPAAKSPLAKTHELGKPGTYDALAQELELLVGTTEPLRGTAGEATEAGGKEIICHRCRKPLPEEHDEDGIEGLASRFCQCPDSYFTLFSSSPQPRNLDWYDKRDDENLDWYDDLARMRFLDKRRAQRANA